MPLAQSSSFTQPSISAFLMDAGGDVPVLLPVGALVGAPGGAPTGVPELVPLLGLPSSEEHAVSADEHATPTTTPTTSDAREIMSRAQHVAYRAAIGHASWDTRSSAAM